MFSSGRVTPTGSRRRAGRADRHAVESHGYRESPGTAVIERPVEAKLARWRSRCFWLGAPGRVELSSAAASTAAQGFAIDPRGPNGRSSSRSNCSSTAVKTATLGMTSVTKRGRDAKAGTYFQGLSSPGWTRTNNPPVNSRMLCQLSYRGSAAAAAVV